MQLGKWITLLPGAAILVFVAALYNVQQLYFMAALLIALPAISYVFGWYALRGLQFCRELPPSAFEDMEGEIVYLVRNLTRIPRYFLTVRERYPAWLEPLDSDPLLFNVGANDTARVAHRVAFRKRGVYRVENFEVGAMDPISVIAFSGRVACEGELVVYPLPRPMRLLPVFGGEPHGICEQTVAVMRGASVDPDGVREYVNGDPLRHIHWRQTARTGKLNVIEFEESQSSNVVIVLDLERGTDVGKGRETTLEGAVTVCASLAEQAIRNGATLRLVVADDFAPARDMPGSLSVAARAGHGDQQLFFVLDMLARVEAGSRRSVAEVLVRDVGNLMPGTTLVVVTSAPGADLQPALAPYVVSGTIVDVVFVDPECYLPNSGSVTAEQRQDRLATLSGIGANTFVYRADQPDDLSVATSTSAA